MIDNPPNLPGCCVDRLWAERAGRDDASGCNAQTCMKLPSGKTCGDCIHLQRCQAMWRCRPENKTCDFFPRRFVDATLLQRDETGVQAEGPRKGAR